MIARRAPLALLALLALPAVAVAQGPPLTLPEASQAATASQRIGLTDITVNYHRPAVKAADRLGRPGAVRPGVARRRQREHRAVVLDAVHRSAASSSPPATTACT